MTNILKLQKQNIFFLLFKTISRIKLNLDKYLLQVLQEFHVW